MNGTSWLLTFFFSVRYFKQKAEKEKQRKRKTSESDDEASNYADNFGTVFVCYFCTNLYL